MAKIPQADPTGWTKSPDDLAYEELLSRYAVEPHPEAPGGQPDISTQTSPKKKGEGSVFTRLLRDLGASREGKYAKSRRGTAPAEEQGGWTVSGAGTAVAVQAPPEAPAPTPAAPILTSVSEEAVQRAKEAALAAKAANDKARRAAAIQAPAAVEAAGPAAAEMAEPQAPAASLIGSLVAFGKERAFGVALRLSKKQETPKAKAEPAPVLAEASIPAPPKAMKEPKSIKEPKAPKPPKISKPPKAVETNDKKTFWPWTGDHDGFPEPAPALAMASVELPIPAPGGGLALPRSHALTAAATQVGQAISTQLDRWGVGPYLDWAFEETYYLGMQILRSTHTLRRRVATVARWLGTTIPQLVEQRSRRVAYRWQRFCDSTLFPYQDISHKTGQLVRDLGDARGSAAFEVFGRYLLSLGRPLNRIANFLAPIVGCTVLAACVTYFGSLTYGLSVEYAGQHLGFIADENVFYSAQASVQERLIDEDYLSTGKPPSFQLTVVQPDSLLDQEALANRLLEASNNEVQTADGIYVEGAFLGAIQDGREFLVYLDGLLEDYRTGRDHETVQFIKGISVRSGIFPVSSLRSLTDIRDTLSSDQPLETVHTVKAEEDLESIAAKYNTSAEQLLALNPTLGERLQMEETAPTGGTSKAPAVQTLAAAAPALPLVQGEDLLVARVDPGLGIKVTWREVYDEAIPFGTDYVDNNNMHEGWSQTISAGVKGVREVTADVTYIDGEKVEERRVDTRITKEPVNQRVSRGTKKIVTKIDPNGATAGSFVWPVKGGRFEGTSVGWYAYGYHTGMDIPAPLGTPIYASRPGTVTTAVNWAQYPYGKQVVINHGDGFITRYAHLSSVAVYNGQWVDQGTYLGGVGSTGKSTGNHLHFEIKYNGQVYRPELYIGRSYNGVWGW